MRKRRNREVKQIELMEVVDRKKEKCVKKGRKRGRKEGRKREREGIGE